MKILKITQCSSDALWYKNLVGTTHKEFVIRTTDGMAFIEGKYGGNIRPGDYEVIDSDPDNRILSIVILALGIITWLITAILIKNL